MTDKMREDFEAWECDADQGPQTDPVWLMYDAKTNTYPLDKIQGRWETWQASRATIEVEFPVDVSLRQPDEVRDMLKEQLKNLGLKVKL